jgi:hypothetical protein
MPVWAAAAPTTAASAGLNRTHTDAQRAASARRRRRNPDTTPDVGSLLVTIPSLTHVGAAPVPRRSPRTGSSRPHTPNTGRRLVRPAATPPAPAARTPRSDRLPPGAAPTPTPRGTTGRPRRAATPTATAHQVPRFTPTTTALRPSVLRARSAAGMTGPWGRGSESVDNTREKRAAVDNKRNPPVPHHPRQREVPLPAYLAPTRGHSRERPVRAAETATNRRRGERLGTTCCRPSARGTRGPLLPARNQTRTQAMDQPLSHSA